MYEFNTINKLPSVREQQTDINTIIKFANLREQQTNILRDAHLVSIAEKMAERIQEVNPHEPFESCSSISRAAADFFVDSLEFLDDKTFFEILGCDEKREYHEITTMQVVQNKWKPCNSG